LTILVIDRNVEASAQEAIVNVSLTPELEQFVNRLVASGQYRSASEVVREGLRLMHDREQEREAKLAALRTDIAEGIASLERGEGMAGDQYFEHLRSRVAAGAMNRAPTNIAR